MAFKLSMCMLLVVAATLASALGEAYPYKVGSGIWDITGPAAEVGMMGYGQGNQSTAGIHFRQRARAIVVEDKQSHKLIAYVNLDICFTTMLVKSRVLAQLNKTLPGSYLNENLLITSTHTHSGPGGFSWYTLYDITSWGWHESNVNTIVNGIVKAVINAHNTRDLLHLTTYVKTMRLYLIPKNNPEFERSKYQYDVDKETVTLRVEGEAGSAIGVINWYPVHGTSMNNWNTLISGDNKGYAMYLWERYMNGNDTLPGFGKFVAIFSNANEGDVSPNTRGAFCFDGTPCDMLHSTCKGKNQQCRATGPGAEKDIYGFESTRIIGEQQFVKSREQWSAATTPLTGGVGYIHKFVDMSRVVVKPQWTGLKTNVTTCVPALGDSFAAGTIDGPGDFDFIQGSNSTKDNPFWNAIAHFLMRPTPEDIKCHYPKPILLATGRTSYPTPWAATILPLQIFNIGHLYIIAVPSEFTTMAGRRLKDTVKQHLIAAGAPSNLVITIAGLSNEYSQYTSTPEEYVMQRYEAASTLYGPHQLDAYRQEYSNLAMALVTNSPVDPGQAPTDWTSKLFDIQPGVVMDDGPIGKVKTQPNASYNRGQQVSVQFHAANPRNDHRTQGTFLSVDQLQPNGTWKVLFVDGHWETKYHWKRVSSILLGESLVTITWDIPDWVKPGTYRITHYGNKKGLFGKITEYTGVSSTFKVY